MTALLPALLYVYAFGIGPLALIAVLIWRALGREPEPLPRRELVLLTVSVVLWPLAMIAMVGLVLWEIVSSEFRER